MGIVKLLLLGFFITGIVACSMKTTTSTRTPTEIEVPSDIAVNPGHSEMTDTK